MKGVVLRSRMGLLSAEGGGGVVRGNASSVFVSVAWG